MPEICTSSSSSSSSRIDHTNDVEMKSKSEEEEILDSLPLQLMRFDQVPPAPNRSDSAIDWIHDFAGVSWVAYGASSLLVVSHFPSPLSPEQSLIGPAFRQVIEPPCGGYGPADVNAVAWSSDGEIAAASENRICLYAPEVGNLTGFLFWKHVMGLVQSCIVESLKWTMSGDGLIAAGIEVVLWKKKDKSWEVAWKTRIEVPQTLVSATWSIEGLVATVARAHGFNHSSGSHLDQSPMPGYAHKCVFVYHGGGKSGFVKLELCHPQSVTMIQWRPSVATKQKCHASNLKRDILLTCCLDGTVRFWCEIDSGRKKSVKDTNDQKIIKHSFHVIAVIEVNHVLKGTLGKDTFVRWALEVKNMIGKSEELKDWFSTDIPNFESVGRCEWLVGIGPDLSLTFWSIHCLDDISPLRFPRVTLWKKQVLPDFPVKHVFNTGNSNPLAQTIFLQAVVLRSRLFGPPMMCYTIQLLPNNSICWSQLYNPTLQNVDGSSNETSKDKYLSGFSSGVLNQDGHTGNILQVAVHPHGCEVELAVSLDSNGLLLFWSLPSVDCKTSLPTLVHPTWKLLGRFPTHYFSTNVEYSTLRWAPSVLNDKGLLFVGHRGGIDCLTIMVPVNDGDNITCHKLCTIPLPNLSHNSGPDRIYTISFPSTCSQTFSTNKFILLGVWMKEFLPLSWNVEVHSEGLCREGCSCDISAGNAVTSDTFVYQGTVEGRSYCIVADPCSSMLPDLYGHNQVTSVAVMSPDDPLPSVQKRWPSHKAFCSNASIYDAATGHSDGSLKLWRLCLLDTSSSHSQGQPGPWELVGMFTAQQGPVSAISFSSCGSKIATIGTESPGSVGVLNIWESVCLVGVGNFIQDDSIPLNGSVIALDWLNVGNGQLLLGVCMQHELRIYARKRCTGPLWVKPQKILDLHVWFCIAVCHTSPTTHDFLWGPRSMPIIVHDSYFCIFSPLSFCTDRTQQSGFYSLGSKALPAHFLDEFGEDAPCSIYIDNDIPATNTMSTVGNDEKCESEQSLNIKKERDPGLCKFCLAISQGQYVSCTTSGLCSILDAVDKMCGPLPMCHPEAVFYRLCSGNWKEASTLVRHLVEYIGSNKSFDKFGEGSSFRKAYYSVPQVQLSLYVRGFSSSVCNTTLQWGADLSSKLSDSQLQRNLLQLEEVNSMIHAPGNTLSGSSGQSEISSFIEALEKATDKISILNMDKNQILALVDLLGEVSDSSHSSAYESLDEPGRRFWVSARYQLLHFHRKFGRSATSEELVVDSASIAWAFHSDCHENLLNSLLPNEPSWLEMRKFGVGYWFANVVVLRTKMEKLARLQYLKKRDPKDCTLLYLALNRLQVLAGLFKISKVEKDRLLVAFLSRNFQEEKNRAAALKNAYVLMGKHQLELAIAFFILGGDPSSAVTICAKHLGDEQLALVICRLIEGYGGHLERHLISSFLLPSAIEKGDYWLASMLEWALGNYSQSFTKLVSSRGESSIDEVARQCNYRSFSDYRIGHYCALLASKTSMKNSVGEYTAGILSRWATSMTASALNWCGLPLEALECLSSSLSTNECKNQVSLSDIGKLSSVHEILSPLHHDASNWLLGDVGYHLESRAKVNLGMQYISKLFMEHPNWPDIHLASCLASVCCKEYDACHYKKLLEEFEHKLNVGISLLEQKYSLESVSLLNMILIFACNNGSLLLGYHVLHGFASRADTHAKQHAVDSFILQPYLSKLLLKTGEEVSLSIVQYIVNCSITSCALGPSIPRRNAFSEIGSGSCPGLELYAHRVVYSFGILRLLVNPYDFGFLPEDTMINTSSTLDLLEYCTYFASVWLSMNTRGLLLMMEPILTASTEKLTPEIKTTDLKKISHQTAEFLFQERSGDCERDARAANSGQPLHSVSDMSVMPENERWLLLGAYLWQHLSTLFNSQLSSLMKDFEGGCFDITLPHLLPSRPESCQSDVISLLQPAKLFPCLLAKLLKAALLYISLSHAKQFVSFIVQKVEMGFSVPVLNFLETLVNRHPRTSRSILNGESEDSLKDNNANSKPCFEILWEIFVSSKDIRESFLLERIKMLHSIALSSSISWTDIHKGNVAQNENMDANHKVRNGSSPLKVGSAVRSRSSDASSFFATRQKDPGLLSDVGCFQNPKEILKRSGELLEAMCINSVDQRQGALSSNRKGLIFFDSKVEKPLKGKGDYVWSESDWPKDGWAGCESTPIPTFVSQGIGLGSKKGAHLGLGGATIGRGTMARPGRDLTGGGAFGIPGYAGVGASGLGWGVQEEFEEFVDPPATVQNISTRALSGHPSMPFFLVGSSNTHVYLWKFGEERATATYGVLPAANVPPPYALASISSLQFDCCGHRFATAALDGTVCTWQLEVGGRSNVYPTESSLCFSGHASDVAYVAASGSVVAVAGYSTNNINLVVWDTLAPPATSQASLMCHEGGARSLSVFDNDLGSGSISPLIVTGGKGGDVGLHDFRFIATGRTKRHRNYTDQSSGTSSKFGEQNRNGMLWHIPKAHQGSITRISTIPNTSLFLTGSKDGDVKLWDARGSGVELIFHWEKMHERCTFLQPSTRGFGGVARVAVTDIQVLPCGFLTCGGDGSVKVVQLKDVHPIM